MRKLPHSVQSLIWWADAHPIVDKKRIITSVFNFGDLAEVKWVMNTYNSVDLRDSVANPLPGVWDKKSLNFFARYFNTSLSSYKKKKALRSLNL